MLRVPEGRGGLAVSGGSDSMALLALAGERAVHVLHVDHSMRSDSGVDAAFVARAAAAHGLPCSILRGRVPAGSSPEAQARALRYAALDLTARELGLDWIATAHTLDDQAETALMRTIRGAGPAGIPPARDHYVRPLLGFTRAALRSLLESRRIEWRDDPSNDDISLERNWIRHELLPQIVGRRAGAAAALARAAAHARDDETYLQSVAASLVSRPGPHGVLVGRAPRAILRRALGIAVASLGLDPDHRTIDALLDGGRAASVVAAPDGDALRVIAVAVPPIGRVAIEDAALWGLRVRLDAQQPGRWWACSIEPREWVLRSCRPGDRVRTRAGTRKVSDVFIDAKVPRVLRDRVPVLARGDEAVAVVGLTPPPHAGPVVVDFEPLEDWWQHARRSS